MSSIRKSASFRSRIPIRQAKIVPRRCYSPPPSSVASSSIGCQNSHHQRPSTDNHNSKLRALSAQRSNSHKRGRSMWSHETNGNGQNALLATYSSTSYSSSDESQESEAPPQVI